MCCSHHGVPATAREIGIAAANQRAGCSEISAFEPTRGARRRPANRKKAEPGYWAFGSLRIMLKLPNVAVEREDTMRGFRGFNLGVALTLVLKSLQIQRDSAA